MSHVIDESCDRWVMWSMSHVIDESCDRWVMWSMSHVIDGSTATKWELTQKNACGEFLDENRRLSTVVVEQRRHEVLGTCESDGRQTCRLHHDVVDPGEDEGHLGTECFVQVRIIGSRVSHHRAKLGITKCTFRSSTPKVQNNSNYGYVVLYTPKVQSRNS